MRVTTTSPIKGEPAGTSIEVGEDEAAWLCLHGYAYVEDSNEITVTPADMNAPEHHEAAKKATGAKKDPKVGPASGDDPQEQARNVKQVEDVADTAGQPRHVPVTPAPETSADQVRFAPKSRTKAQKEAESGTGHVAVAQPVTPDVPEAKAPAKKAAAAKE